MRASMTEYYGLLAGLCLVVGTGCSGEVLGPMTDGRTSNESIAQAIPVCSVDLSARGGEEGLVRGGGIRNDIGDEEINGGGDQTAIALFRAVRALRSDPPPPFDEDWNGSDPTQGRRVHCDLTELVR